MTRLAAQAAQKGIAASSYNLQLGDAVFALMGIKESAENDALFKWYMRITNEVVKTGIETNPWLLDRLAKAIYKELKQQKAGRF